MNHPPKLDVGKDFKCRMRFRPTVLSYLDASFSFVFLIP